MSFGETSNRTRIETGDGYTDGYNDGEPRSMMSGGLLLRKYIQWMKQRDPELKNGRVQIVHTLSIETPSGEQRMLCANTEGLF
jgi:hypothetical protein